MSDIVTVSPPPAGVVSNFVNPSSNAAIITVINGVFMTSSLVSVLLRIHTRANLVKSVGIDDYLLLIALMCALSCSICSQVQINYGLGKHAWDVPMSDFSPPFLKLWMAGAMLYSTALLFVKVSFLFLYRRLFSLASRSFRVQWWITMIFTAGYGIAGILTSLMACLPIAMSWDITITHGRCIDKTVFYIVNAVFNVVSDLAIFAIPIPIVLRTSLSRKNKIIVCCLFASGSFTCVVSMVRIKYIVAYLYESNIDVTRRIVPMQAWSLVEMHFAVLCACSPTLKPFVQRYLGCLKASTKGGSAPEEQASDRPRLTKRMSPFSKASPTATYRTSCTFQKTDNLDNDAEMALCRRPSCVQESDLPWCGPGVITPIVCEGGEYPESRLPQDGSEDIVDIKDSEVKVTTSVQVSYEREDR